MPCSKICVIAWRGPASCRTRLASRDPGMSSAYLRQLVESWREFDWRAREAWLNGHPQFIAEVGDATIHFVHARAARAGRTGAAGDARLAAPVLVAARLRRSPARLPRRDPEPPRLRVLPALRRWPHHGAAPGRHHARADDRGARLRAVPDLRRGCLGQRERPPRSDAPEAVSGILVTHAHFPSNEERDALTDPAERAFFDRLAAAQGRREATGTSRGRDPTRSLPP